MLEAVQMTPPEAARCAASLVDSNMRGYDSHGVMRLPFYVQMIENGEVDLNTPIEVVKESPTSVVANANWGLGQTVGFWLADKLIEKAKQSGMAIGTMYLDFPPPGETSGALAGHSGRGPRIDGLDSVDLVVPEDHVTADRVLGTQPDPREVRQPLP
jgi:hypothetical protein